MPIDLPQAQGGLCAWCVQLESDEFHVARSRHATVIVPPRSTKAGALVVVPHRHVPLLTELDEHESLDLLMLARQAAAHLVGLGKLEAFNFWWDTGLLAGQCYRHVAIEILPRSQGDGHVFVRAADRPEQPVSGRLAFAMELRDRWGRTAEGESAA